MKDNYKLRALSDVFNVYRDDRSYWYCAVQSLIENKREIIQVKQDHWSDIATTLSSTFKISGGEKGVESIPATVLQEIAELNKRLSNILQDLDSEIDQLKRYVDELEYLSEAIVTESLELEVGAILRSLC